MPTTSPATKAFTQAPSARAWYAVWILTVAYVLSFIDRQILTLLVPAIQADLALSDVEVSLLIGAAFAVCYCLAGLGLGWLVDRFERRGIAVAGVTFWSLMTALCGTASSYAGLFLARMGVGVGEATLSPAAYSLMADALPPDRLVRGIGIYSTGAVVGIAVAYALGGLLVEWATATATIALPLIGVVRGWQAPFFVMLVPGLVVAALLLYSREPARRHVKQTTDASLTVFLRQHGRAIFLLFFGMGLQSIVVQSILSWGPSIMTRRYHWAAGEIGIAMGTVLLIAGVLGNVGGAFVGSRRVAAGGASNLTGLCLASSIALICVAPLGAIADTPGATLAVLAIGFGCGVFATAPALSALQLASPGELRGRMTALFLLTTQLIGMAIGPTLVAVFTQYVFRDPAKLFLAQASAATFGAVASAGAFFLARRGMARALAHIGE